MGWDCKMVLTSYKCQVEARYNSVVIIKSYLGMLDGGEIYNSYRHRNVVEKKGRGDYMVVFVAYCSAR